MALVLVCGQKLPERWENVSIANAIILKKNDRFQIHYCIKIDYNKN